MENPTGTTRAGAHSNEIAKQVQVELALLANIEYALRIALDWKTENYGIVRKLSTLRFVTRSFERHLTRLRLISEHGGYMQMVTDAKPELRNEVLGLTEVRNGLQTELERMIVSLEHLSSGDVAEFDEICTHFERYLEALKLHGQREMELFQRVFFQEEGGSG